MVARGYYLEIDGRKTRVPSVTGILSKFKDPGGLMYWANQQGLDGNTLEDARESTASVGTIAHAIIEADVKGLALDVGLLSPETLEGARVAYGAFNEWREMTGYSVVESELSLVSEAHRFGGTFDAVVVSGKRVLVDWKTSRAIYPEHYIQVAAYGILWEEHRPDEPLDGFGLLRLGKESPSFAYHYEPASSGLMQDCRDQFMLFRRAYDLAKEIKRRAG